jgi:hypothetical protein
MSIVKWMKRFGLLDLMKKGRGPMERRFVPRFADGEGICDYAVLTDTLEQDLVAVRVRDSSS